MTLHSIIVGSDEFGCHARFNFEGQTLEASTVYGAPLENIEDVVLDALCEAGCDWDQHVTWDTVEAVAKALHRKAGG